MTSNADWKIIGEISASGHKTKILSVLNKPKTPKQISTETNLYLSHVSKGLKDLSDIGLVNCLTPELRKGKLYALTEKGNEIFQTLK
ncbi:hypothetical protein A3K64_00115 [Candidatus Micrarchaeota archaeon RBG_16_36_9]|nr:MAG: hypothetical protein A3K64_00115 [Candidatus Micrarchaeota archaeon RBG_16_36_9]